MDIHYRKSYTKVSILLILNVLISICNAETVGRPKKEDYERLNKNSLKSKIHFYLVNLDKGSSNLISNYVEYFTFLFQLNNIEAQKQGQKALGRVSKTMRHDLIKRLLAHPNESVRFNSAHMLDSLSINEAEPLFEIALADDSEFVRANAVNALAQFPANASEKLELMDNLRNSGKEAAIGVNVAIQKLNKVNAEELVRLLKMELELLSKKDQNSFAPLITKIPEISFSPNQNAQLLKSSLKNFSDLRILDKIARKDFDNYLKTIGRLLEITTEVELTRDALGVLIFNQDFILSFHAQPTEENFKLMIRLAQSRNHRITQVIEEMLFWDFGKYEKFFSKGAHVSSEMLPLNKIFQEVKEKKEIQVAQEVIEQVHEIRRREVAVLNEIATSPALAALPVKDKNPKKELGLDSATPSAKPGKPRKDGCYEFDLIDSKDHPLVRSVGQWGGTCAAESAIDYINFDLRIRGIKTLQSQQDVLMAAIEASLSSEADREFPFELPFEGNRTYYVIQAIRKHGLCIPPKGSPAYEFTNGPGRREFLFEIFTFFKELKRLRAANPTGPIEQDAYNSVCHKLPTYSDKFNQLIAVSKEFHYRHEY